jgi:membrane associated rhomboid family serine protease
MVGIQAIALSNTGGQSTLSTVILILKKGFNVPAGMLSFVAINVCLELWKIFVDIRDLKYSANGGNVFFEKYALRFKTMLQKKQWYRLVTGHFLHAGPIHLLVNMKAAYLYGLCYEKKYGTLRLVEATAWAILMGSLPIGLALKAFPRLRLYDVPIVGFSEVLYFWVVIVLMMLLEHPAIKFDFSSYSVELVLWEIYNLVVRERFGSAFHILGFLNGLVYVRYIRPRYSLPTQFLWTVEVYFDKILSFVSMMLGLSNGPYVVESAPM